MKVFAGIVAILLLMGTVGLAAAAPDGGPGRGGFGMQVRELTKDTIEKQKELSKALRANLTEQRDALKERLAGANGTEKRGIIKGAKPAMQDARQDFRGQVRDNRQQFVQNLKEIRDSAQKKLQDAKDKVKSLRQRVNEMRGKPMKTEKERKDFKDAVIGHVQASFDERISAAKRLEAEGVNASLVAGFVSFAEAQKVKLANETNNTMRVQLITEFNAKWQEFKKASQDELQKARLSKTIEASRQALADIRNVTAKLKARGDNVTKLEAAEAKVEGYLNEAANAANFTDAVKSLSFARKGLEYLKQAIRLTLRKQAVEDFLERIGTATASPTATAEATATPAPTATAVSASPTPNATPTITATPTATETPTASPSTTASATPTTTPTATPAANATA